MAVPRFPSSRCGTPRALTCTHSSLKSSPVLQRASHYYSCANQPWEIIILAPIYRAPFAVSAHQVCVGFFRPVFLLRRCVSPCLPVKSTGRSLASLLQQTGKRASSRATLFTPPSPLHPGISPTPTQLPDTHRGPPSNSPGRGDRGTADGEGQKSSKTARRD